MNPCEGEVMLILFFDTIGIILQYSPDIALCDFWAFLTMKRELQGKLFPSNQEVKMT
jgi:hypothetical protein